MATRKILRDGVVEIVELTAEEVAQLAADAAARAAARAAVVPEAVTNLQFRKAIRSLGAAAVTAFKNHIGALSEELQEEWQFEPMIRRDSAKVEAARVALNRTNAQIDTLFRLARTL